MKNNEQLIDSVKSSTNEKSIWQLVRHQFVRWSVRIGFIVIVVAMVLAHFHGLEEKGLQFGLLLALILFLSEQMIDTNDAIAKKIDIQIKTLDNLIDNTSYHLLRFVDCLYDLEEKLKHTHNNEKVLVEIIGINLSHAWQYFENALIENNNLKNIECRLLILTDDENKISNPSNEVKEWCGDVPRMLEKIINGITNINQQINQEGRKISVEIKKYAAIPTIHGLAIKKPFKVTYITFCRWGGISFQNYKWGESKFYKIDGYPDNDLQRDLLEIFDGYFNHLWMASDKPDWSSDNLDRFLSPPHLKKYQDLPL